MRCVFGVASLMLSVCLSTIAQGSDAIIPASADGAIQSSGVLGLSVIADGERIRASRSGGSNIRRGIFQFDLSAIPAGSTIDSASLQVTTFGLVSNIGASAPIFFDGFTGDGTVSASQFDSGTDVAVLVLQTGGAGPSSGTVLDIPFTNVAPVQDALDASGFLGINMNTVDFVTFQVHSTESTTAGITVPTLDVHFTAPIPEPGTLVLAALVFLPLSMRHPRR